MTPPDSADLSLSSFIDTLREAGGLDLVYTVHPSRPDAPPLLEITLAGPDTALLLERNGELLHAIESLAASILHLEPDQISIDADGFKAARVAAIGRLADEAVASVRSTGKPFLFAPMNSRERRLLHLALLPSGLATASSGLGPRRFVVLYPAGHTPEPERFEPPSPRPGSFRNKPGFTPRRDATPARNRPSASPAFRPSQPTTPAFDPETHGNRAEPSSAPPDAATGQSNATDARLDSIRRAFRKR